jgi:hypothetical protein
MLNRTERNETRQERDKNNERVLQSCTGGRSGIDYSNRVKASLIVIDATALET